MHAASYATSAEIAAEVGPFPRYEANRDAMLRVDPQPSPGRLQRAGRRVRGADHHARSASIRSYCPAYLLDAARRESRPHAASSARSTATATPRSRCIAPTGTIGLVMDCDTTGVEPDFALVKFKKLAGGGYFKIINASIPPALRPARLLRRSRSTTSSATAAAPARCDGCPHINPRQPQGQGLHRRRARSASRRSCPAPSSCRSSSTAGRSATTSATSTLGFTQEQLESPGFDLLTALGFTQAADRRGQRLRLRHHDHRRRAAPEAGALPGLRLRQQVRQDSASASCRPSRTSA